MYTCRMSQSSSRVARRVGGVALAAAAMVSVAGSVSSGAVARPSRAASCTSLARLSDTRLAAATLVVPAQENDLSAVVPEVREGVGGVILLGSAAPADLARELALLQQAAPAGVVPWVMVDEEGGSVQRLANLVGNVPSARTLGATETAAAIQALARTLGAKLKALGVSMDLAPVLDADGGAGPNSEDADGTRSFSANPAVAAAAGLAFAEGLERAGVVPVVKHFPGLGGATGNTDVAVASTLPWGTLRAGGLVPFERAVAAHLPAVMVSNAAVPGLSALPASISPTVITGELRQALGFHGLVLTDSLSAISISGRGYSLQSATVRAIEAGADLVLYNATVSGTASVTSSLIAAITAAISSHQLSRATLLAASAASLTAHGVTVCPS